MIGCLRLEMGVTEIEAAAYPTEEIDVRTVFMTIYFHHEKDLVI